MGICNSLWPKSWETHSVYIPENFYHSHWEHWASSTSQDLTSRKSSVIPSAGRRVNQRPDSRDGDKLSAPWWQAHKIPTTTVRTGSAVWCVRAVGPWAKKHKILFPATVLCLYSTEQFLSTEWLLLLPDREFLLAKTLRIKGRQGRRGWFSKHKGCHYGERTVSSSACSVVLVCWEDCWEVVLLWEVENTLYVLPTHPYCPQGATVPKIFEDGQNLINPSPQQGVVLIQTHVHSPSLNLAYSQRANSGRLTPGNLPLISAGFYSLCGRLEQLSVDCGGCLLLSHCVTGLEGEGVLLAHMLWVCSPLDDPAWNFTSPSKAPCRQKGEIALRSVPLLHPNMVSASREQWLKKDFKNRHYLSSGRAIKRNTSQVVSVNTITLQIQGKKSR